MNETELRALFKSTFPFWEKMSERDKETFLRSSQTVRFKKGTNIHDGNECTGVILIKSGSLRLYLLSEDGKSVTATKVSGSLRGAVLLSKNGAKASGDEIFVSFR